MRTRELELVAAVLLFPPRFAVMAVAEVLAYLVCSIATTGHDPAVPLVPWRRQLMRNVVVPCCHVVLATIGIWSVRIDGMPDPSAKLVVCNHVCLLDGFVLVATLGAPSFVARLEGLAAVPLYGTIVRALQVLFVNRQDTASRRECADAIADRAQAAAGKWPRRKLQMQALAAVPAAAALSARRPYALVQEERTRSA
jgi:1-acyl-sn-glycerol-3-phosphate acyltransferase